MKEREESEMGEKRRKMKVALFYFKKNEADESSKVRKLIWLATLTALMSSRSRREKWLNLSKVENGIDRVVIVLPLVLGTR